MSVNPEGSKKTPPVNDLDRYSEAMHKSMMDKLYFMDKVDARLFFDYGCADGELLRMASTLFPHDTFFGYDEDPEMVKRCPEGINVTSDRGQFDMWSFANRPSRCLVLSSVVHEMYSYKRNDMEGFWNWVFNGCFEYIALRDMCVSRTTSRPSDSISVAKVRIRFDREKISQWESRWGSLDENWSLTHFLLTYRYEEGWDREMRENYLPVCLEELLALVPKRWEPVYIEHYTLPFVRSEALKYFGIDLQDRTHLKLILKRSTWKGDSDV